MPRRDYDMSSVRAALEALSRDIWNDPVWSKVIATVVVGVSVYALSLVRKNPRTAGIFAAVLLTGSVLAGSAWLIWLFLRPPIAWRFDNFLGMVGGGGELRIISFQATGFNRSGTGHRSIKGHLVSNIDNSTSDQLRFVIGGVPVAPSATTGIPPGASFQITISLCDASKGYDGY